MQEEKEEQRSGRNKATAINARYIEGGQYRKIFDQISEDKDLNRLIYHISKDILYHRSGTSIEDMYWIDVETREVVAKEIDCSIEGKIEYSDKTKKIIKDKPGLLTIHSHPMGLPPSIEDLNSNYLNSYSLGIVIGHNGKVFLYRSNERISTLYFSFKVASYSARGYNEFESRKKALEDCCDRFDVFFKEVSGRE